ncbi:hypothetical protein N7510_005233 [Penicillium lagena]|uniref:uncharacterized protein n=1 Tax=Penicillium lagena TaxID=94218 RepID=UPI00253F9A7A|nr:uncharacterized protein N7510_005233 [Penicillium lagena]KAJ5612039.1 hypothetical protein N7510_005233 [Penicillium lagena]
MDQDVDIPKVKQPDNDNEVDMSAAEAIKLAAEEEDHDDGDQRHKTASIELGDDDADLTVHLSRAESRLYDTEAADGDEEYEGEDSEPKNWWSDDPFTQFKLWARADQDVRVERRRRGGAKILVDENGLFGKQPILSFKR